MAISLRNETAIAGIGVTEFSKDSGVSELTLAAQCVLAACTDAGVDPAEIDGLVSFTLDSSDEVEVARAVGAGDLTHFSKVNYGGGAAVGTVAQAVIQTSASAVANKIRIRFINGCSISYP